jgi:hypothetical protein
MTNKRRLDKKYHKYLTNIAYIVLKELDMQDYVSITFC